MVVGMTGAVASLVRISVVTAFAVFGCRTSVLAQSPDDITGAAILKHPAGQLAVKAAELLTAGKTEQVIALGTKSGQDEWKTTSADDRKGIAAMMQRRAPVPATFADAILKAGVLAIMGDSAILRVELAKGDAAITTSSVKGTRGGSRTGRW